MNTIIRIAKAELRTLFYSPVAWFLSVIFMVQCGLFYTNTLYGFSKWQELGMKSPNYRGMGTSLTKIIFLGNDSIFSNVMMNLYLFIPLLTMGIFSREITNGSIKLLYSSPIKTRSIVFGKFLSMMLFNLLLIAMVGVFLVTGYFNIESIDGGLLLAGTFGFYLLICAYAAIGLFMSSLTTYQIVSAIGTFVIVFVLSRIGGLWQDVEFVRDLTYFLSMNGRTTKMLNGLITTKDVCYFLIVIAMFIAFTLIKLNAGRRHKPWYIICGKYLGVVGACLLVGYVSSRPHFVGYWDTTANKVNTIHPRVQKVVEDLGDEPLEVTLYVNLFASNVAIGLPANRNNYLTSLWEKYVRFKPNIVFKYEYYYDVLDKELLLKANKDKTFHEIAKDVAHARDLDIDFFKTPEEMKKQIDLSSEDYNGVMQLKYKDKTTFLRFFSPEPMPGEEHVAAALSRLQSDRMPKIIFTTGNLERDVQVEGDRGYSNGTIYKTNRTALVNNGFDIDSVALDSQDLVNDSSLICALVVADPKTELSAVVKQKLSNYIEEGRNLLIIGEPGKQDILNPVLEQLGVLFKDGILVQVSRHQTPDKIVPYVTKDAGDLAEEGALLSIKQGRPDPLFLTAESAVPIEITPRHGFEKKPLLVTVPRSTWLKTGKLVTDSVPPAMNESEGDSQDSTYNIAVALTRQMNGREQRIVVLGDGDLLSNKYQGGVFLGRGIFSWLIYNEYPKYGPVPPPKDTMLSIIPGTASTLKLIYVWIVPAIIGLLGGFILIRRKRK